MRALERSVEWLRPFVESKSWDYCVVWKLGDDPSRFIEWIGCCCSGGNEKEKRGKENHLTPLCRDDFYIHPIRTKACEALLHFPSFIPLYSGIHGEVVNSTQPRWYVNASSTDTSDESTETRVLIPVRGGVIEFFGAKHIPKDQKVIDLVKAHFDISIKQEPMTAHSYTDLHLNEQLTLDQFLEANLQNLPPGFNLSNFIPLESQSNTHPSLERSSSGSNPSNEQHPSVNIKSSFACQNASLKRPITGSSFSKRAKTDEFMAKQKTSLVLHNKSEAVKDNLKATQRPQREGYQSKNLITERNRRNRIKDGLFTLRALVPKISKMDKAAILSDAIEYIGDLKNEIKKLEDEIREIEEEDRRETNEKLKVLKLEEAHGNSASLAASEQNQSHSGFHRKEKLEVHAEVNQIGRREFLVKLFCEHKQGGFARLMEAMDALAVQVVDANITTFKGKALSILRVEARERDIQAKKLRESLIELTH